MKSKAHNPLQLDVAALAEEGAALSGRWPLSSFGRLTEASLPEESMAVEEAAVDWTVRGESRSVTGGAPEIWLHLQARATPRLQCQRCLEPVDVPVEVERRLRFVRGEDQAAALDADSEDDVLALERSLDLRQLMEDELLLAVPLVPRHDVCPQPLPAPPQEDEPSERPASPFAVLESLKSPGSPKRGH